MMQSVKQSINIRLLQHDRNAGLQLKTELEIQLIAKEAVALESKLDLILCILMSVMKLELAVT